MYLQTKFSFPASHSAAEVRGCTCPGVIHLNAHTHAHTHTPSPSAAHRAFKINKTQHVLYQIFFISQGINFCTNTSACEGRPPSNRDFSVSRSQQRALCYNVFTCRQNENTATFPRRLSGLIFLRESFSAGVSSCECAQVCFSGYKPQ